MSMQGFLFAHSERNLKNIFAAILENRSVSVDEFAPSWGVGYVGDAPAYQWYNDTLTISASQQPLYVGLGIGEYYVASHRNLLKPVVHEIVVVPASYQVVLGANNFEVVDENGVSVPLEAQPVTERKVQDMPPAGYRSHFEADIYSQAEFLKDYFGAQVGHDVDGTARNNDGLAKIVSQLKAASHVYIVGSGSGYHAALIAQQWFEFALSVSCSVDLASEFVARSPLLPKDSVVLALDCGDNLQNIASVLEHTKAKAHVNTLVLNRANYFDMQSFKAPTTPVAFSYELALLFNIALLGLPETKAEHRAQLPQVANDVQGILGHHEQISALVEKLGVFKEVFVLGRGVHFGLAKELEFRLRQICAVHAVAFPIGEFKHGNIALVSSKRPLILINPSAKDVQSTVAAVRKVAGAKLPIIVLTSSLLNVPHDVAADMYRLPISSSVTEAFVYAVAIQLLVLEFAQLHGRALDVPE